MTLNVTITQGFATNEHVMDVLTFNNEALLKMMLDGIALAGAGPRRGTVAVQDSDFPGMKIAVTGTGLTYDTAGHLTAGTIGGITVLNASGATIGSMTATGGLGIDVAALKPIISTPAQLEVMFGDWQISYSAATVPTGFTLLNYGAYFEGGLLNDTLTGSNFNDYLGGGSGNDTIRGGAGTDVLDGDDTLYLLSPNGNGNDVLFGEDGSDLLRGRGGDDRLYGGAGGDTLTGDQIGETGNDLLLGGDGDDALWGGEGNDTLNGGAGYDRVTQPLARSGDFVFAINLATGVMTGEGTDTLIGIEGISGALAQRNLLTGNADGNGIIGGTMADTLNGGAGADRLNGADGADSVAGGLGNDKITGGTGLDVLRGNGGADHFIFTEAGAANADQITDFVALDQIDIYQGLIGFAPAGALAAGAFKLMGAALDADDRVIYDRAKGEVWVDGDGSGAQVAQLLCKVTPGMALSAADFGVLDFAGLPNYL